jgi:hypothetical protein
MGSFDIPTDWGVLTPNARLEARRGVDKGFLQRLSYSDTPEVNYDLNVATAKREALGGSLGLRAEIDNATVDVELGASASQSGLDRTMLRGRLGLRF